MDRSQTSVSSSTSPIGLNIQWVTVLLEPMPSSRAVSRMDARRTDSRFSGGAGRARGIGPEAMVVVSWVCSPVEKQVHGIDSIALLPVVRERELDAPS